MKEARTDTLDPSHALAAPLPVRLVVLSGPDTGLELEVHRGTVLVGTHEDCQLKLTDRSVSRRHVSLELESTRVRVHDLGSKNGTRYLGAKFEHIDVPLGASLQLGQTTLVIFPLLQEGALSEKNALGELLGRSVAMRRLFAQIEHIAPTDTSCLVQGETGTGKELVVRTLHQLSMRARGPLVAVQCGSINSSLVSSVLFGHVRGAFTGAVKDSVGLVEAADGGTLLLDDIAALPLDMQPILLRVLESGTFQRVGEGRVRTTNLRVIATSTQNLQDVVSQERFRSDLYFRLASITLTVPPLRDRLDDIPLLAQHFASAGGAQTPLPATALAGLCAWRWPGNVRELKSAVERAVMFSESPQPNQPSFTQPQDFHRARELTLAAFEKSYLEALLQKHKGSVAAVSREAAIARSYLYRLLETHGLSPEDYR